MTGLTHSSRPLAWLLWPGFAALPWLLPVHALPWTTFYSEWLMALFWVPMGWWFVWRTRQPVQTDLSFWLCVFLAAVPLAQAAAGLFLQPGEALFVAFIFLGVALTLLVAKHAETTCPGELLCALFNSLLIAAWLSACMTIYQWLRLDHLGLAIAELPYGGRPVANVGQANNLSTLLVWGLVALWWRHLQARDPHWLTQSFTLLSAVLLLAAVALTQSRTGWLAVGFLACVSVLGRRVLVRSSEAKAFVILGLWFGIAVLAVDPLTQALHHSTPLTLMQQTDAGKRPVIWAMALQAIHAQPLFGYGWNQSVRAFLAQALSHPELAVGFQHAHNLVLDLMLWVGVPLGLLLTAVMGGWLWQQCRAARILATPKRWCVLAALGVFFLHAMLELPHVYLFFLLPVAVMVGSLNAMRVASPHTGHRLGLPRWLVTLPLLASLVCLGVMFDEYGRIAEAVLADRLRAANVGNKAPVAEPKVTVLNFLQEPLVRLRTKPRPGMATEELAQWRFVLMRYPGAGALVRYAQASAWNQRPQEAQWALTTLCAVHRKDICQAALQEWTEMATDGHPEMNQVVLPVVAAGAAPAARAVFVPSMQAH
jgi:O-antigen ligase